ncbi:MAG: caspase domain-containing protein [Gemmataceae bacterium]
MIRWPFKCALPFVLALCCGTLHAADAPAGKKYAILVGVNAYDHARLPALKYAVNDAAELGALLGKQGYIVTLLTDATGEENKALLPTKINIEATLKTVFDTCKKDDTLLIGLAGHGLQFENIKDAFFCPSDARPFADRTDSLVSLDKLYRDLDQSFAGVKVLLVDACRDDPNATRGARGLDADNAPRPPRGVAALFSCSAGERAFEHDSFKHGLFFHFVLEGLQGAARDADNEVSFDSLSLYVRKHVARQVGQIIGGGARQSPNLKADLSGESPVLLRVANAPPPPKTDVADPKSIIRRAIKAHQYPDAEQFQIQATMVGRYLNDGIWHPTKTSLWVDVGGRQTRRDDTIGPYSLSYAISANSTWKRINNQLAKPLDQAEASLILHQTRLITLLALVQDPTLKLSLIDGIEVDGRPTYGIRIDANGLLPSKMFFDREQFLMVRRDFTDNTGRVLTEYHLDHKRFDAIRWASKQKIHVNGEMNQESEVTSLRLMDGFSPKLFAP